MTAGPVRQRRHRYVRRISVEELVDAASEVIESDGLEALTLRRIAERVGVGVTTIYGYVRTKDELLGLFADRLFQAIDPPGDEQPWDQQITHIFSAVYRVLVEHPELAKVVASRPAPGTAASNLLRVAVRVLVGAGLTNLQVTTAYTVLAAFTTGFVQQQSARDIREPGLAALLAEARNEGATISSDSNHEREQAFYTGLALIIKGIEGEATA